MLEQIKKSAELPVLKKDEEDSIVEGEQKKADTDLSNLIISTEPCWLY